MNEPRIIGGMFGLDDLLPPHPTAPAFLPEGRSAGFFNARSALLALVRRLRPRRAWLPAYLCGPMLEAFDPAVTTARFYAVDERLGVGPGDWIGEVSEGDMVLLIDYFGWPLDAGVAREARRRGAWVVEDACQALLSAHVGREADFVVFSPRKFVGVPDGGVLVGRAGFSAAEWNLQPAPADWSTKALEACVLRREFDRHGGDRRWFELFREVEAGAPVGAYAMSQLSMTLLRSGFDYEGVAARRRANYDVLAAELPDIALFGARPADVVPLGFPVRCRERDRVRQALFRQGIYPPVHWPLADAVPPSFAASHRLSAEIMTLPCDQRGEAGDMRRQAAAVKEALTA